MLRLLFSLERNRDKFKRLFPDDFYGKFIDIGHYKRDPADYVTLRDQLQELLVGAF